MVPEDAPLSRTWEGAKRAEAGADTWAAAVKAMGAEGGGDGD